MITGSTLSFALLLEIWEVDYELKTVRARCGYGAAVSKSEMEFFALVDGEFGAATSRQLGRVFVRAD